MRSFVEVKDLVVQTHIGCGEYGDVERSKPQNIGVSMRAYFDVKNAYQSDDLTDTVNYMQLIEITRNLSAEKPRHLLETLAFDISSQIFKSITLVKAIDITLEKYSTASGARHVAFSSHFER